MVNQGSPQNKAKCVASNKRKSKHSEHEQSLCDRYALQCMSQCVASKKRKSERSEHEQSLCDRYALQCMSKCILTLSPPSSARCLMCFNMQNADTLMCDCKRPLHSLTICVRPHQSPEPQPDHGRGTTQIQHRRGLDRQGSQVHYSVLQPNPVLLPRQPLVSCATA